MRAIAAQASGSPLTKNEQKNGSRSARGPVRTIGSIWVNGIFSGLGFKPKSSYHDDDETRAPGKSVNPNVLQNFSSAYMICPLLSG